MNHTLNNSIFFFFHRATKCDKNVIVDVRPYKKEKDKIQNEILHNKIGIAYIEDMVLIKLMLKMILTCEKKTDKST